MHLKTITSALTVLAVSVGASPLLSSDADAQLAKRAIIDVEGGIVECWTNQPKFSDEGIIDILTNQMRKTADENPPFPGVYEGPQGAFWGDPTKPKDTDPILYYCFNGYPPYKGEGFMSRRDFDHATFWMDEKCGRYQPAYFRWAGTDEIVGRTHNMAAICGRN